MVSFYLPLGENRIQDIIFPDKAEDEMKVSAIANLWLRYFLLPRPKAKTEKSKASSCL